MTILATTSWNLDRIRSWAWNPNRNRDIAFIGLAEPNHLHRTRVESWLNCDTITLWRHRPWQNPKNLKGSTNVGISTKRYWSRLEIIVWNSRWLLWRSISRDETPIPWSRCTTAFWPCVWELLFRTLNLLGNPPDRNICSTWWAAI